MKYFKHMTNMRHDVKIRRLISRFGIEGYGVYNLMLEAIAEKLESESPVPDFQETFEDMAEFYNGNIEKINEIANFMANQGLFELDELSGRVLCSKMYKFLEASQTRSEYIRKMIKSYKNNELVDKSVDNLLSETVTDKSEDKIRIDKIRLDYTAQKEKKKPSYTTIEGYPVVETTHNKLVESYTLPTVLDYYERISDYVSNKNGKDYKDYAGTARNWIKKDIAEGRFKRAEMVKSTEPDELEQMLLAKLKGEK